MFCGFCSVYPCAPTQMWNTYIFTRTCIFTAHIPHDHTLLLHFVCSLMRVYCVKVQKSMLNQKSEHDTFHTQNAYEILFFKVLPKNPFQIKLPYDQCINLYFIETFENKPNYVLNFCEQFIKPILSNSVIRKLNS